MAIYQALTDLSLGGVYIQAGDTFTDTGDAAVVPSTYIPPANAVTPLDTDGVNKVFAAGPHIDGSEPWRVNGPWGNARSRWVGMTIASFSAYWRQLPGSSAWVLNGQEQLGSKIIV